jgi:cytoskeletal protein CcmA (bactofilin family)
VDGDIVSPRVAIAEGAHFRGSVDMQRKGVQQPGKPETAAKTPSQQPAQTAQAGAAQRVGA